MPKNTHMVQSENDIDELGIQVRSTHPEIYDEKRIYILGGVLYVPKDGKYVPSSVSVYETDPTNVPMWINDTENKIKYVASNGTIKAVNLDIKTNTESVTSIETFLDVLNRMEAGTEIDLSNSTAVVDMMLEDHNDFNTSLSEKGIKVVDYTEDATIKRTTKSSSESNFVEGVIKYEAQNLQPDSINTVATTSTIVVKGNVLPFVSPTQKFIVFEEVKRELSVDEEYNTDYYEKRDMRGERASYYLLDSEGNPAIVQLSETPSYDDVSDLTTLVIDNQSLDITMGVDASKIRLMPFNVDVKGGSVVDSILLDNLKLVEAYSDDTDSNIIGSDELLKIIRNDFEFDRVDWVSAKHSPNKKYWLVWCFVGTAKRNANKLVIYYSNDGLSTLHKADFEADSAYSTGDVGVATWSATFDLYTDGQISSTNENTHISDCGEVLFFHSHADTNLSGVGHPRFLMGRIDIENPEFGYHAGWAKTGTTAFEATASYAYYILHSEMDFETGILAVGNGHATDNGYVQFYAMDFEKFSNSRALGYFAFGADYAIKNQKAFGFWADFEGDRWYFLATRHTNAHWYCYKARLEDILSESTWGDGSFTKPSTIPHQYGVSTDGSSANQNGFLHALVAGGFKLGSYKYDVEDKTLSIFGTDWTSRTATMLMMLDFSRTWDFPQHTLTSDVAPTSGSVNVRLGNPVYDYQGTEIEVPFDATAESIQAVLDTHPDFLRSRNRKSGLEEGDQFHLWGKFRRNNFSDVRVFTCMREFVIDQSTIEEAVWSNLSSKVTLTASAGIDASFKVRGEKTYGPDMVVDGDFETNLDNWELRIDSGSTVEIQDGELYLYKNGTSGNNAGAGQEITCEVGKKYEVSIDLINHTGTQNGYTIPYLQILDSGGSLLDVPLTYEPDTYTATFVATETTHKIYTGFSGSGSGSQWASMLVDNFTMKEVETVIDSSAELVCMATILGAQGGVSAWINGEQVATGLNSTVDSNDQLSTKYEIKLPSEHLIADGVTDNVFTLRGNASDTAYAMGVQIGFASDTRKTGIEFEVFTKAGIKQEVEFNVYDKNHNLKDTITAGVDSLNEDTLEVITIGAEYLYGDFDYVTCSARSNSRKLEDCYVRRSTKNFITTGDCTWKVTGDWANGFVFECGGWEANMTMASIVGHDLDSTPSIAQTQIVNFNLLQQPTAFGPYQDVTGGAWILDDKMLEDSDYNSSCISASANSARNNTTLQKDGETIYISSAMMPYSGSDTWGAIPMLMKIPSYKEFIGTNYTHPQVGTATSMPIANSNSHATYGERISQTFVVPDSNYEDGQFHLRTFITKWFSNHASSSGFDGYTDDKLIRCKIVRLTSGYPDDSKVLGESLNGIPVSELTYCGALGQKQYFMFDDLRLTPTSEVAVIYYIDGTDMSAEIDGFRPSTMIHNTPNAGHTLYIERNNVWTEYSGSLDFWLNDSYICDIRFQHKDGWNKYAKVAHPYDQQWRECSETTIAPMGGKKYTGTYRNSAFLRTAETSHSPTRGASKFFTYCIDDTEGQYAPFTVSNPSLVEAIGNDNFEPNLVFSIIPSDKQAMYRNGNGTLALQSSAVTSDGDVDDFQTMVSNGGYHLSHTLAGLARHAEIFNGGITGRAKDPRFKYGTAFQMSGNAFSIHYHAYSMCPYHREFAFEIELEVAKSDLDGGQHMLFESLYLQRFGITATFNGKQRYSFYHDTNFDEGGVFICSKEAVVLGYQRLRFGRSHEDGIFIERNFTKDDEDAWTRLDLCVGGDEAVDAVEYLSGSRQIGQRLPYYPEYFRLGGYSHNTAYRWYGKIGYVKYIIGSSVFKADTIERQDNLIRPQNLGNIIFGLKSWRTYPPAYEFMSTDLHVFTPEHIATGAVKSYPQVLKYSGEITNTGNQNTIEVELSKKSDSDPTALKGIYFDFQRR